MNRDKDCMRDVLLFLEESNDFTGDLYIIRPTELGASLGSTWTPEKAGYAMLQLIDAGFVHGKRDQSGSFAITMISHQGHEFLDTVRDKEVWDKAKSTVKGTGTQAIGLAWEVARALGIAELKNRLGLH